MGSHQQTKMGEGSKQVRVDNWGIFFLQRLQMFFNKTDYCDLTLQFEGNVQLKVHRLVMNACTEYFRILEQTCEIMDDVLIMPPDLQADVVLPIVNFMYTGMLEFHMSIFDKLYKTANLMNITVLTKLLDAQKIPIQPLPKPTSKRNVQIPHTWNLQGKKISAKTMDPDLPAPLPGRKLPVWKRKSAPTAIPHTVLPHYYPEPKKNSHVDPLANVDNTPKPTRFEWPEDDIPSLNVFGSSFDQISYTSKPLFTQDDEPRPSTSFDRIKETPDSGRRTQSYDNLTVDIDDVKDYVNEQKIRSHMAEDDDEDDVDFTITRNSTKRKSNHDQSLPKRVRFNINNEKENQRGPKINIMPTGKIASDVDHTKIISEVLKKYPNLVKKNKNIRLKILAKTDNTPMPVALEPAAKPKKYQALKANICDEKIEEDGPWKCDRCSTPNEPVDFVLYYLFRKHMTDMHNEKFDSRMCKFCGHKSTKHNMLMYHQYTKHGIKPPPMYKFPKCNLCPYIALSEPLLVRHKMNHNKYELQCSECNVTFTNQQALTSHVQITGHSGKIGQHNFDCQYCTKKFQSGSTLFAHIRMLHREEARRDGIVSIDEADETEDEEEDDDHVEYITPEIRSDRKEKVKILSDVKLPSMEIPHGSTDSLDQHNVTLERSSEAEALNNVASGIATSLGLVDVVVLDENQQYILHANNQQSISSGESEFILPDLQDARTFSTAQQVIASDQNVITQSMLHNSDIGSTDELVMVLTDHDYGDGNNEIINSENSNIVVLYSHPIEGQENQFITSQGNIMLTSQAGLIELRNSNAVVTTASTFINTAPEPREAPHIESIEMIQREINQHPDMQDVKPSVPDALPTQIIMLHDGDKQANTFTAEAEDDQLAAEAQPPAAVIDAGDTLKEPPQDAIQQNDEVQLSTPPPLSSPPPQPPPPPPPTTAEAEKDTATSENTGIPQPIEDVPPVSPQPDVNKIQSENQQITESSVINEEPVSTEENVQAEIEETQDQPNTDTVNEDIADDAVDAMNLHIEASPERTDTTDPLPAIEDTPEVNNSMEPPELEPTPDATIESACSATVTSNVSISINPPAPVENETEISDEEKNLETHNETNEDVNSEDECNETHNEPNENVNSEDECNETETSVAMEEHERKEESVPHRNISDKSARIILEDWDDTDSQQSDPKTSTNVNKLIDDWDDDEDERKG